MPNEVNYIKATYNCPECEHKVVVDLPYVDENTPITKAVWCPFMYCEARHQLEYSAKKTNDKVTIKGLVFHSNEKEVSKRVKLLT